MQALFFGLRRMVQIDLTRFIHEDFVMRNERPIKYEVLELRHSHHYGEARKLDEMVYFAGISSRNRFSNE